MKALDAFNLIRLLYTRPADMEVRIGDVAEGSDLHCSVGKVEMRGNCIVLTPGEDDVWKDEMLASAQLAEHLWPPDEGIDNEA
jgi:hypothetical protein